VSERLRHYIALTRLNKPIGILLLLWPTLWAVWIAGNGRPDWMIVAVFVLGTVLMRSAGCVINDYADRDFDAHVKRTAARPLAAEKFPPGKRWRWPRARVRGVPAGGVFSNRLTLYLSFAALFLAASYPFTKRFFALPQAYLGIAFGFGIPMAFAAATGEVGALGWTLLVANVFWALAYDTEYAMVDREDDLKIGIRTALCSAVSMWYRHGLLLAMLSILTVIGADRLGWPYFFRAGRRRIALYRYVDS
jgi:4-hydroxybenzoate polyprenyltransferase